MDYSDDGCMNLFTQGQKTRMQSVLGSGGFRASLANSNACGIAPPPPPPPPTTTTTCSSAPTNLVASNIQTTTTDASWDAISTANDYVLQYRPRGTGVWWTTLTPTTNNQTLTGLQSCTEYEMRVRGRCSTANGGLSPFTSLVIFTTTGCASPPGSCTQNAITYTLITDNYASETSWDLKDANGTVIESGNNYNNNQTYTFDWCLPNGCYDFTIYDTAGDGICCIYGNGSYSVVDANNNSLASGGQFGSSETTNFCVPSTVREGNKEELNFSIAPNPANDFITLLINGGESQNTLVRIYDLSGKVHLEQKFEINELETERVIELNGIGSGVYFISLNDGFVAKTEKLVIVRN